MSLQPKFSVSAFRLIIIGLSLQLISCQTEPKEYIPDVSDIEVNVPIRHFEQDLFQIDTTNMEESLSQIYQKYPEFAAIYFEQLLGANDPRIAPEGPLRYISGFINHPFARRLYDTTQIVYQDFSPMEEGFHTAFQFYRHYFPERPIPDVTTFISEYSLANFIYKEQSLAVGLDFFLGPAYPYQAYNAGNPNFSNYLVRTYNPDHLVRKTLQPLVEDLTDIAPGNRLLDFIIHNGKKLYVLDHLLPYAPDTVIVEFSPAQLQWCQENEANIWAHFLSEDLLYSSQWQDIRKLVEASPNSPGMPPEAPGRTGNWLGWQIIKSYMNRNPEMSMEDLLAIDDAQLILDQSRYKPQRK
ncbi:MAG: hypothetical protein AAFU60_11900 [Bacteroidota bacterium]